MNNIPALEFYNEEDIESFKPKDINSKEVTSEYRVPMRFKKTCYMNNWD